MKKFSKVAVLFAVVCLSLSACGNSNKNNATDTNQSQVEEDNASGETGTVKEAKQHLILHSHLWTEQRKSFPIIRASLLL